MVYSGYSGMKMKNGCASHKCLVDVNYVCNFVQL